MKKLSVLAAWLLLATLFLLEAGSFALRKLLYSGEEAAPPLSVYLKGARRDESYRLFAESIPDFRTYGYYPFEGWRIESIATPGVNVVGGFRVGAAPAGGEDLPEVWVFGGSTVWGHSTSDEGTLPSKLQLLLPGFRVLNYGEQAFSSRQSLNRFLSVLSASAKKPRAVLFYEGANDAYHSCKAGASAPVTHAREELFRALLRKHSGRRAADETFFEGVSGLVVKHSQVFKLSRAVSERAATEPEQDENPLGYGTRCAADPKIASAVAKQLVDNWAYAENVARANGIELHGILQPTPYTSAVHVFPEHYAPFKRSIELVYPSVRRFGAAHAWFTDASGWMEDIEEPVYVDECCHLSSAGNQHLAKKIKGLLAP